MDSFNVEPMLPISSMPSLEYILIGSHGNNVPVQGPPEFTPVYLHPLDRHKMPFLRPNMTQTKDSI